jgi:uncharacterized protein YvpB
MKSRAFYSKVSFFLVLMFFVMLKTESAQAESVFGFYTNFYKTYYGSDHSTMNQIDNKAELRNTCGAMSALIVNNHYARKAGNTPSYTQSNSLVTDAIKRLYAYLGKPLSEVLSDPEIVSILKNKWGFKTVKLRSSKIYPTFEQSYQQLRADLNLGRPAITLMKGKSAFSPIKPNGERETSEHYIVVYSANDSGILYVDPWTGKKLSASKQTFEGGWVCTFLSIISAP